VFSNSRQRNQELLDPVTPAVQQATTCDVADFKAVRLSSLISTQDLHQLDQARGEGARGRARE